MKNFYLILIVLFVTSISLLHSQENTYKQTGYGVEPFEEYKSLLNKPVKIMGNAEIESVGGDANMKSDYHMLSTVPLNFLSEKLVNLDRAADIFSRITKSIDLTPQKIPQ
jgi:hypothetical protein